MNWISTKHKLPEQDGDYLVHFIGWDDMDFIRVLDYEKSYNIWSDHHGDEYIEVKNWMPLPEPPKE